MKKKGFMIAISIISAIVLLFIIAITVIFISGNQITTARCIVTDSGILFMVYDDRPVQLNYGKDADFQTGDKLLIIHQSAFAESYPEQTKAYLIVRIGSGSADDIPENAWNILREVDNNISAKHNR